MPTSADFETAAARLRTVVASLEEFVHPLENRMGAHVLEGGELTDSVYESLKTTRVTTLSLSAVVEEYAAECTRRMEEANAAATARDQYREDLEDYERNMGYWNDSDGDGYVHLEEEPIRPAPPPDPPDYIDI